jgi:hypothetical protein
MIQVDIKVTDNITKELTAIQKQLRAYPQEAVDQFRSLTPIDRGNARRKTVLKNETIELNYPYAERLDNGWSKQAPNGMTQPFEKWVRQKVKRIFGK